jgi:hypothetical protein
MAASAGVDYAGTLKVTSLLNGVTNINTNTGSTAFDVSPYVGTLMVVASAGNGVSGTVIVPSIKAGADTNISNATNFVVNATNFSNVGSTQVINVDLRSTAFGAGVNKYMYLTWLITGSATANSALAAEVIGQQKYSS